MSLFFLVIKLPWRSFCKLFDGSRTLANFFYFVKKKKKKTVKGYLRVFGLKGAAICSPVNKNHCQNSRDWEGTSRGKHWFVDRSSALIWVLLRNSYRRMNGFIITPTDGTSANWRLISHMNCYTHQTVCKGSCSIWINPPPKKNKKTRLFKSFFPHTIRMLNSKWRAPSLFLCIE